MRRTQLSPGCILFTVPLAGSCSPGPLAPLQSRQREYKLAALHAKQQGDNAAATRLFRVAKVRPEGRTELDGQYRTLLTFRGGKELGLQSQTGLDLDPGLSLPRCTLLPPEASVYPLCEMGVSVRRGFGTMVQRQGQSWESVLCGGAWRLLAPSCSLLSDLLPSPRALMPSWRR